MTDDKDKLLDQLWYTWSKDGLDSMPVGYRVRAASEGLHNLQDLRYRRLDRFLRYEMPQGTNTSEFDARIAPISLSFIHNGYESLLIRKVFKGRDYSGRNSVFFTHLIAGLPPEFTAFDAIRLWYCPDLWRDSDAEIAPNVTMLRQIPYSKLRGYVEQSQTQFNFSQVSEQLQSLLLTTLSSGMPSHVYATGQSIFTAALIYGLTHCLPMTMLKGLTFTTYESNIHSMEAVLLGTITWTGLQGATELSIQPASPTGPVSSDIQTYTNTAIKYLLTGDNAIKLTSVIKEAEEYNYEATEDLIGLFKHRFHFGPLTTKRLETIILHADKNLEDLLDPGIRQESAALLLDNPDYWEKRGSSGFTTVNKWLYPTDGKSPLSPQAREAQLSFVNALAEHVFDRMREVVLRGSIPFHPMAVLRVMALGNDSIYRKMLTEFAQDKPVYMQITTDDLWKFHFWLLQCAKVLQPQPTVQQMQPWLGIPSWEKLDQVLKYGFPTEWEQLAMFGRLEHEIPRGAVAIIDAHEAKFTLLLQVFLQQGAQPEKETYSAMVVQTFKTIVEIDTQYHSYPNRAALLLALLNTVPKDPHVVEDFFSVVRFATPHQLTAEEYESVLEGCSPEVLRICVTSPVAVDYLREYLLSLSPDKFKREHTVTFLRHLQQIKTEIPSALPESIPMLLAHWLVVGHFLLGDTVEYEALTNLKRSLQAVIQAKSHAVVHGQTDKQEQLDQQNRYKFMHQIIPFLLKRIKREHQLEISLEVLGEFLANTRWELLGWMAAYVGQNYTTNVAGLSALTPYLLCGIWECVRTQQTQAALDEYLDTLFSQADNAFRNIETAIMSGIWPDFIGIEWKGWRDRKRPSWQTNIANMPIVNRFVLQQPKPAAAPQPGGLSPAQQNGPTSRPLPEQHGVSIPQPSSPTWSGNHQAPQLGQMSPSAPSSQEAPIVESKSTPPSAMKPIATLKDSKGQNYSIPFDFYQKMYPIMQYLVPYWYSELKSKQIHTRMSDSRSHKFEIITIEKLEQELRTSGTQKISKNLMEYFIDDILIKEDLNWLVKKGEIDFQSIDFTKHKNSYFYSLKQFLGQPAYQRLCELATDDVEKAFCMLYYRYRFFQHLEDKGKHLQKWLEGERKKVKIEYHF